MKMPLGLLPQRSNTVPSRRVLIEEAKLHVPDKPANHGIIRRRRLRARTRRHPSRRHTKQRDELASLHRHSPQSVFYWF